MTDRGDDLVVEGRFAVVPEWLLRAPISSHAKVCYAVIQRHGNSSGARMPSQAELAAWMHVSEATVSRANTELEAYGAMRVTRSVRRRGARPGQFVTRNRYFLVTSDPAIGHLRPPARLAPVQDVLHPCKHRLAPVLANREVLQEPPPPAPSKPEEAVEIPVDVHELAAELRTHREAAGLPIGRWTARAVRRAIAAAVAAGYLIDDMPAALLSIALDPSTQTPGRLAHDGPWWTEAELRRRTAERAEIDDQRRRAEAGARAAAEAEEARRRAACFVCDNTGLRRLSVEGREITAICTHGQTETESA